PPAPAAPVPNVGDAPPRESNTPSVAHRAEYYALRTVLAGLDRLSWRRASAIGARLGRLGYAPLGIRRDVVERQIAAAFPTFDADRVRDVAVKSFESLGRTVVEAALLPSLGRDGVLDLFERVDGWDVLE